MNKLILVDVDGVILQWGMAFGAYIKHEGLVPDNHLIRPAYKVETILNISRDEATVLISKFHASDHFNHLTPYKDAALFIPRFSKEGYKFVAISAALQGGNIAQDNLIFANRFANLNWVYPDIFETLHLVPMRASKHEYLSSYTNAFWVEDTLKNAITGVECGHKSIFINRTEDPRRQGSHPDVINVSCWDEIYDYIHTTS